MESLKNKKFKSFEKDQVMKLNLVTGGQSGSTWTSATQHGTDYTYKTFGGSNGTVTDWHYDPL